MQIPQVRGEGEFYPSSLERGVRSERALKCAVAEMYVQGVSTRKVTEVMRELCGLEVSSTQVSRATRLLDEELERWRNRSLGEVPSVFLDARGAHNALLPRHAVQQSERQYPVHCEQSAERAAFGTKGSWIQRLRGRVTFTPPTASSTLAELADAESQAYMDGNKRAAFLAIGWFLSSNGDGLMAEQADAISLIKPA